MMKVWGLALAVFALAIATNAASAQDDALFDEIMRAYEAINLAFEQGDAATIETLVAPNHVSITSYFGGPVVVSEQMAVDDQLLITQSAVGEIIVSPLSDTLALQQFVSERSGSFQGEPISGRAYVTILWTLEGGVWLERMYQETPLP